MFTHILVPLDGSTLAENVLPHAVALGRTFDTRVTLLRVIVHQEPETEVRTVDPLAWELRKSEARVYLEEMADRLEAVGLETERMVLEGEAAERICEYAQNEDVDLILLSSHGRSGLSRWNINSVVQKVILRAYIPTMIVRAYESTPELGSLEYRRLLAPVDGSQRAEYALPLATNLAQSQDAQLIVAQVVTVPETPRRAPLSEEERDLVDRLVELNRREAVAYMDELRARLGDDVVTRVLVSDHAALRLHELIEEENIDLAVLSAHGYSGESRWPYGSVALNFIAYGTTPLLIAQDLSAEDMDRSQAEKAAQEEAGR